MVIASMFPPGRKVVKPIKCEYTRILDNMLLLRTYIEIWLLQMNCDIGASLLVEKRILNSTIIAYIEVCFIRMQCVIGGLICIFKRF